ncbi:hypothetical protein M9Y10_037068 [Tritrichomonas musculus]|uniref:HNH nuclease domain-containing protein n=1 Tax=Tritrichomonas musculus TaxID=1915356 RepID=A0ABR2GSV4_9EUKA
MAFEIERLKQTINELRAEIKQQQETINEYKKQNELLQQEVDKLSNELKTNEEEEDDDEISPVADNEDDAEWLPLKGYENDYKIYNCYPYPIKKISNDKIIRESINTKSGYVQIALNGQCKQKHIIVAKQFIRNNDRKNKPIVDHIDRNRANYNVSNLRWVSQQENMLNRSSTKRDDPVKNIPDEAIVIDKYGDHQLENYYYYDNVFYFYNGIEYNKLYINETKRGYKFVNVRDVNNKKTTLTISVFKKLYDLI